MELGVRSVMVLGMVLSLFTALLFLQVARGFPVEHRRHMRIWTAALVMLPVAWLALAQRGIWPDVVAIGIGTVLMQASFAEMTRAVRGFHGLPERRWLLWSVVIASVVLSAVLPMPWPHSSGRVILNSAAGMVLLLAMAWALRHAARDTTAHAGRAAAAFALLGVVTLGARLVDHVLWPRPSGQLLEAGASDLLVFLYMNTGVVFLSLAFVLMHAERAYAAVRRLATVDTLTGVLARSALDTQGKAMVAAARRSGRPLAALLVDLDQFKQVNDGLGHEAGDRLLQHLAMIANRVLRGEDLLCRLGGDEFVVLLPNTDGPGGRIVAERLRAALVETPFQFRGRAVACPMSIGVAAMVGEQVQLDVLVKRADEAMYVAKRAGGDRVHGAAEA
ncbi:GGDEF domain-containing protein [Arenimonas sp. MALMAid1274]|uniref:GGDEF domain-containing protein n=1 Tax=Arenimonas sp. MALMAid1274 TaxID=3411630 RepID=UPI003BA0F2E0